MNPLIKIIFTSFPGLFIILIGRFIQKNPQKILDFIKNANERTGVKTQISKETTKLHQKLAKVLIILGILYILSQTLQIILPAISS